MAEPPAKWSRRGESRWIHALYHLGLRRGDGPRDPGAEPVLAYAATLTDAEILDAPRLGPVGLAWIRANQPREE